MINRRQFILFALTGILLTCSCSKDEYAIWHAMWHPSGEQTSNYPSSIVFSNQADSIVLSFSSNRDIHAIVSYGRASYHSADGNCQYENSHDWISLSGKSRKLSSVEFEHDIQIKVEENKTGQPRVDTMEVSLLYSVFLDPLVGIFEIRQDP